MKRYCGSPDNECEKGKQVYYAWLNKLGLDDTKPYRKPQEAFNWAKSIFNLIKQDNEAKYYKVEALFPVVSMNNNIYTEEELVRAARTLIGKPVSLNHKHVLRGVEIVDAEYEDGAVEVLLRVLKTAGRGLGLNICNMIENGEILHVSIEASCRNISLEPVDGELGRKCEGLVFTGLALLTKDVLPGVPLTRIEPLEKIVESVEQVLGRSCALCGRMLSDYIVLGGHLVHPKCARRFWAIFWDIVKFTEEKEEMNEKEKEQLIKEVENVSANIDGNINATIEVQPSDNSTNVEEPKEKVEEKQETEEQKENKEENEEVQEREWDTAFINSLPDAAFAVIEPAYERGETKDKRCRHLPHHGPNVKNPNEHESVDIPHLRNALARMNQIKPITDSISAEDASI